MKHGRVAVPIAWLLVCSASVGQTSQPSHVLPPDEAMRRLEEKQRARQVSTTQPSIESLSAEVVRLTAENRRLRGEIEQLKQQIAQREAKPIQPGSRPSDPDGAFKKLKNGMRLEEVLQILGNPGGPGIPAAPVEDSDGNARYYWRFAQDSQTMGWEVTAWFKNGKLDRAEKQFR